MQKKDFQNWTRERLLHEYRELLKRKKFGLVWEDKPEDVAELCKASLPVLKDEKKKAISTNKNDVNHVFIEGDNYHTLSVLNYTHKRKIDVIYIDPPYNTGNRSWKYNNHYVEKDDRYQHSKWLSFISKRLRLARNLLTDDGIIIITIDDYELFYLGSLMDEIFLDNRLGVISIMHNPRGRSDDKFFATSHEYALVYAKNSNNAVISKLQLNEEQEEAFNLEDEISQYRLLPLRRSGSNSRIEERPNLHYPIFYNPATEEIFVENPRNKKCVAIYPIDTKGIKRVWRWGKDKVTSCWSADIVIKKTKTGYAIYAKDRIKEGRRPKTIWIDPKYDASSHGTVLLEKILQKNKAFDYPKSLYAIIDFIDITTKHKKNAIVLDFFAGSGTTGHAVLELNKRDNGKRQFVLCTDNQDNNGSGTKIASDICYPRIKNVMIGYSVNGKKISGLGGNLHYYSTEFVGNVKTDNDKRVLTSRSAEMLCLAEGTFEEVITKKGAFAIYQNDKQMTGIIYDEDAIEDFKKEARKHKKSIVVYVFSYDHTYNEENFENLDNLKTVKPIPEVILNVYRKIYKELYKPRNL